VYEDSNISTENFKFLHKLARLLKRLETRANDIYMSSIEALKSSQEKELNRIKEMSYWEFLKWRKKIIDYMERQLATIQVISELRPIPGADNIEVALMSGLGWECVVKKGEFKKGDIVVYVEVDSVMPDRPEYEFLRDRKFRVKTIKLRGQVSMGLVLPITILEKYGKLENINGEYYFSK
jgi:hypothetical protein